MAKQGGFSEVSCHNCGTDTQLDVTGLFGLPHDHEKQEEIKRFHDSAVVLRVDESFRPFFDEHSYYPPSPSSSSSSSASSSVSPSSTSPSVYSTSYSSSPLADEQQPQTHFQEPQEKPQEQQFQQQEQPQQQQQDQQQAQFQQQEQDPRTPEIAQSAFIENKTSHQTILIDDLKVPEHVSASFFKGLETLDPKDPSVSLQNGWVDFVSEESFSFPKEWKEWKNTSHSRLLVEILGARDLSETDSSTTDPYVALISPRKGLFSETLTPWVPNTKNPSWQYYTIFDFDSSVPSPKSVAIEIWNRNYIYDSFLGRVEIPLDVLLSTSVIDKWWALGPHPNTTTIVTGEIHLRLHYRKKYDQTSEAGEEIRIINDMIKRDAPRKRADEAIIGSLDPTSADYINATRRLSLQSAKNEKYIQRKNELHAMTLLSTPLTPFELEDSTLTTADPSEVAQMRILKIDSLIQRATEEYQSHKMYAGTQTSLHKERFSSAKLRLEYLLFFMQSIA
eukprot:CAMPEP_0201480866 /NCGR_PEP_ID=MMETSP0151_2-20130828/5247_1 /ASSEMBLY_ACC=CAM_ASM_000257 /TAXON_ID=200890 /ORGANISM="Paramoeba atlantica, Strain 621/1 / CCAP 1560/9" /LENGTH=503 /DNA_ID=CAMNT_0047862845 /DNA_START=193 /DNA_END=1700 /DNA_ORIENTATION=+